jgi:hypothetical protein
VEVVDSQFAGTQFSWSERLPVTHGVSGSRPVASANVALSIRNKISVFRVLLRGIFARTYRRNLEPAVPVLIREIEAVVR